MKTQERPLEGLYSDTFGVAKLYSSAMDHRSRYQFAARLFVDSNADYIGDMGCGTGESTAYLRKIMSTMGGVPHFLLGVDVSPDAISAARLRNIPDSNFIVADLSMPGAVTRQDVSPGMAYLDGIVFAETIEPFRHMLRLKPLLL